MWYFLFVFLFCISHKMREAEIYINPCWFFLLLYYTFVLLFPVFIHTWCEKGDMWTRKNVSLLDLIKDFKINSLSHVDTHLLKEQLEHLQKNFQLATNFPGTYFPIYILISSDSLLLLCCSKNCLHYRSKVNKLGLGRFFFVISLFFSIFLLP